MSDRDLDVTARMCPRCRSTTIDTRAASPIAGIWILFACSTCLYVWRSTEPEENRDPNRYPKAFRLVPHELADLPILPAIQPPRGQADGG
jgi:vanillate/4-hydroxybenzoate decarboxylase subunit D